MKNSWATVWAVDIDGNEGFWTMGFRSRVRAERYAEKHEAEAVSGVYQASAHHCDYIDMVQV